MPQKKIKVTLIHSTNRRIQRHKDCVRGLGLRKRHQTVELQNTPEIRGMIDKVSYLLKVEEV